MARHITLCSDSHVNLFPQNEIGSFRIKLPQKIYVNRERHKIGLKYISWPHKTRNIEEQNIYVHFEAGPPNSTSNLNQTFRTKIEAGFYPDVPSFIPKLNNAIKRIPGSYSSRYKYLADAGIHLIKPVTKQPNLTFSFDEHTEMVTLRWAKKLETKEIPPRSYIYICVWGYY